MKTLLVFPLLAAGAFAQETLQHVTLDRVPAAAATLSVAGMAGPIETIKGAPYSATITNEMIQTLADGNRIVQRNQSVMARDSQGRVRHEAILPVIGNMNAKTAPKMIFISDPVAGVTYSLNEADKTYRKMSMPTAVMDAKYRAEKKQLREAGNIGVASVAAAGSVETVHIMTGSADGAMRVAPPPPGAEFHTVLEAKVHAENMSLKNESLGSKVFDGVMADGVRTVRTLAAGEVGNEKPIEIVSEIWSSPELKTIIYSKRSDPRNGDMIYSLTNLSRAEPDASLFAPPADYKESVNKDVILYRTHE